MSKSLHVNGLEGVGGDEPQVKHEQMKVKSYRFTCQNAGPREPDQPPTLGEIRSTEINVFLNP